ELPDRASAGVTPRPVAGLVPGPRGRRPPSQYGHGHARPAWTRGPTTGGNEMCHRRWHHYSVRRSGGPTAGCGNAGKQHCPLQPVAAWRVSLRTGLLLSWKMRTSIGVGTGVVNGPATGSATDTTSSLPSGENVRGPWENPPAVRPRHLE